MVFLFWKMYRLYQSPLPRKISGYAPAKHVKNIVKNSLNVRSFYLPKRRVMYLICTFDGNFNFPNLIGVLIHFA